MIKTTKYNWGIIGAGWIAYEVADAPRTVKDEVYAIANPNEISLEKFAAEKNIKRLFINPDEMIQDPNIDIIYIATPHTFHYDYIEKALKTGKHVFCEKAIMVSIDQLNEVEKLAKDKHLILPEGFTLYHMSIYQKIKKLIRDDRLGQIKLVQVNSGNLKDYDPNNRFFNKGLAGEILLDVGGYVTAFARIFLSKQPESIPITVKLFETGVDEQSGIILKSTKDEMAVMALSIQAKQPKRGVVSGTKGYIEILNYPRAAEAQITYTASAHEERHEIINIGSTSETLEHEIKDMERYISQGHDDGELAISRGVAHTLTSVRTSWGIKYPPDENSRI